MKEILQILIEHRKLSISQSRQALMLIAEGKANSSQIAAFLTVFLMRNITVDELTGFRDAMLELCISVDLSEYKPIDLCGTGGDGKNTFNISTTASFVVAGAGINVAKHGNHGVSSNCGSSNVMTCLGYNFITDEDTLKSELETAGIAFLHAPTFHPAMKAVAPVRQGLGIKTFFNMLGPLVNPAKPKRQLIGVFDLELARKYQYLLQNEMDSFTIIHTISGFDEISLTAPVKLITKNGEAIKSPEEFGFLPVTLNDIKSGGSVKGSADILTRVLKGEGTYAQRSVVIANAAMAISTAKEINWEEAVAEAKGSLDSGRAYKSLKSLLEGRQTMIRT